MGLRHFKSWFLGKKGKDGKFPHSPSFKSDKGFVVKESSDSLKFAQAKGTKIGSSSSSAAPRRIKKKWQSREERKIEKIEREYDVVMVPSDGGSEGEDSDWSIGWLEPHGSEFFSDDETDDSFAVLVPCYKKDPRGVIEEENNQQLLTALKTITNEHFTEGKNAMEHWLSSLQKS